MIESFVIDLQRPYYQTQVSVLYKAKKNKDELQYMLKSCELNVLAKEKTISQRIENTCKKSIVIPILEIIEAGDKKQYAVMQYRKNGMFLDDFIHLLEKTYCGTEQDGRKKELPFKIIVDVLGEILQSIRELHTFMTGEGQHMGYLHLDLHPKNIFFESVVKDGDSVKWGGVKFIDWQNALELELSGSAEKRKKQFGTTIGFSAPELKNSHVQRLSPATDLYSVAAIGMRLYVGKYMSNPYISYADTLSETAYREGDNSVCEYLLRTFLRKGVMDKMPDRFQSAEEMLKGLEKIKKCLNAFRDKNYYDLFSVAYDMGISDEILDIDIIAFDQTALKQAVDKLFASLMKDYIYTDKCLYIFRCLRKIERNHILEITPEVNNVLLDCGMACFNHIGYAKAVIQLHEQMKLDVMDLMGYAGVQNRLAEAYADQHDYKKAYLVARRNVMAMEKLKEGYAFMADVYELKASKTMLQILNLGRAYSACARFCVFCTYQQNVDLNFTNEEIMNYFNCALEEFDRNKGNRAITISHIMHYALQKKKVDRELYETYAGEYFPDFEDRTKCLKQLCETVPKFVYSLYLYLKGMYLLYMSVVTDSDIDCIRQLLEDGKLDKMNQHPVQLIYKYIALILFQYDRGRYEQDIRKSFEKALNCFETVRIDTNKRLTVLTAMSYQTKWIYNHCLYEDHGNRELLEQIKLHSKKSKWEEMNRALEGLDSLENLLIYEQC